MGPVVDITCGSGVVPSLSTAVRKRLIKETRVCDTASIFSMTSQIVSFRGYNNYLQSSAVCHILKANVILVNVHKRRFLIRNASETRCVSVATCKGATFRSHFGPPDRVSLDQ